MPDENKQLNKAQESQQKEGFFSVSDSVVFRDTPQLAYLYKKTEKLVSALYMLSGFISDKEPIKWQMREAGTELLSQSLLLSDRLSSERKLAYAKFISTGLKFLSFLEVSYCGGIVSEMNYNVLKYEFENLIKNAEFLEGSDTVKKVVFPDRFFSVSEETAQGHRDNSLNVVSNGLSGQFYKGQNNVSEVVSVRKENGLARSSELKKKDKTNRQDIIINLLKKNSELGIKDFILSIKDCSEKTIQRELVSLVSKGQIKKVGEKRWSRYSLK